MSFRIVLEKEDFKFSCSHFTIFGPGVAERLHGHNYYVVVELGVNSVDPALGMAFDFNVVKPIVRELTRELDERMLLPASSAYLKIEEHDRKVRATFLTNGANAVYDFPMNDVKILPVVNITSEELARFLALQVFEKLKLMPGILSRVSNLSLGVQETRGQTVFFDIKT